MSESALLEIGVEEIPHEILSSTIEQLGKLSQQKLSEAGIIYKEIQSFGTPRRLAILLKDVEEKTSERVMIKKGPSLKAAFDEKGNPTKALEGFLSSNKASLDAIEKKEISGNIYIHLSIKEGGSPVTSILPDVFTKIIFSLTFPKTMKWSNNSISFVRPIRWIASMYGSSTIDFTLENIKSSNLSYGHRILTENQSFKLSKPELYIQELKEKFVIVNPAERRKKILEMVDITARKLNAKPIMGEKLLDTLVQLTEYPEIAIGYFEEDFLKLPKEVLISEMIEHQKYIPLENSEGDLINRFLIITNIPSNTNIVNGNERVIRARLSDGKFFFDEDKKKKLEEYLPMLANVTYARGLGTLLDKVERIKFIVNEIANLIGYEDAIKNALRTATLCKADLVTSMVYEFPELQGIIGYYYALNSMENINVAISIKEHYLPKYSGDNLPSLPEGILVSLADKFDSLLSMYSIGNFVTGSKDPYGLRRQTLGIIRILIDKKIHLDMNLLFQKAIPIYKNFLKMKIDEFITKINDFMTSRIKTVLKEYNFSYDEIEAGITENVYDIYDSYLRIEAIHTARMTENFKHLAIAFKRVKNIIKGLKIEKFDENLISEDAEKGLYDVFIKNRKAFLEALEKRDYKLCVSILTSFRPSVDRFFDEVLVMDENEKLKNNRVAMLSMIDQLFMKMIDFEKIVLE